MLIGDRRNAEPLAENQPNKVRKTDNGVSASPFYLVFLWVSMVLSLPMALLFGYYEEQNNNSDGLKILLLLAMIPSTISYMAIAIDVLKTFKGYVFLLAPLVLLPKIFIVVVVLGTLSYLSLMTWHYFKKRRADSSLAQS